MKKIKLILKIIILILLCFMNFSFILAADDVIKDKFAIANLEKMISFNELHTNIDNKMNLIYFYNDKTLNQNKYNTIKNFISETECKKVVNFVDFKVDGSNPKEYMIYSILTNELGSNTIILLDKSGSKIEVFTPDEKLQTIETTLKNIIKNYI